MTHDPFNSEGTLAKREERSEREQQKHQQVLADTLFVMSDPAGRRFMRQLFERARVFHSTFAPGDPHQSAFNEGLRTLGLTVLVDVMEVAPSQYATMMEEAKTNAAS